MQLVLTRELQGRAQVHWLQSSQQQCQHVPSAEVIGVWPVVRHDFPDDLL